MLSRNNATVTADIDHFHMVLYANVVQRSRGRISRAIAATVSSDAEAEEFRSFLDAHRIDDQDRIIRRIVLRGLATEGIALARSDLVPEITITAEGVYWHPVGAEDADLRKHPRYARAANDRLGLAAQAATAAIAGAGARARTIPWQQLIDPVYRTVGQPCEHVGEPGARVASLSLQVVISE
jgi:hypothetical protein